MATKTTVRMKVTTRGPVTLSLYDVLGRRVLSIHDASVELGIRDQEIDTSTLTNGIYLVTVVSGEVSATQMIVVNR